MISREGTPSCGLSWQAARQILYTEAPSGAAEDIGLSDRIPGAVCVDP